MHTITHQYQPTNHTCSQTSLAMLLSFFGQEASPKDLAAQVPVTKDENGNEWGTINQQLATWCLQQGFAVELHTADFQVIDLAWANLSKGALLDRLRAVQEYRNIPSLGRACSKIYVQSYIDFVEAGGELHIHPYMTSKLLDSLLERSPLLPIINFSVLYNSGRNSNTGLREAKLDDVHGKTLNHSIVIYGKDDSGNYLIVDPWEKPGQHAIEPERLLAAMAAAQMECDNLLFQLSKRKDTK